MKALSIKQPWAWLIVNGFKDIENRSWRTKVRGEFLIHASLKPDKKMLHLLDTFLIFQKFDTGFMGRPHEDLKRMIELWPGKEELQYGGIVGKATLAQCLTRGLKLIDIADGNPFAKYHDSEWFNEQFGFVLTERAPIDFIPLKGQLGFFEVPAHIISPWQSAPDLTPRH